MRRALLTSAMAYAAIGLAACGGGGSSSTTAHHRSGVPSSRSRPSHIYRVTMTGSAETPRGAAHGSGDAIIAVHGDSELCWRFAHLHGFADATAAHIHLGTKGHAGKIVVPLSTASRLHHQGCVRVSPTVVKAIAADPSRYYVNVHSAQYPAGAIRAQL